MQISQYTDCTVAIISHDQKICSNIFQWYIFSQTKYHSYCLPNKKKTRHLYVFPNQFLLILLVLLLLSFVLLLLSQKASVKLQEDLVLPALPLGRGPWGYWAKRRWPPPFEVQHYQAAQAEIFKGQTWANLKHEIETKLGTLGFLTFFGELWICNFLL